jgi:hypothetical protein
MGERLAVGMSGGPVVGKRGACVGVFQGVVPSPGHEVDDAVRPLQVRCMTE